MDKERGIDRLRVEARMVELGFKKENGEADWRLLADELGIARESVNNYRIGVVPGRLLRRWFARVLNLSEQDIWPPEGPAAAGVAGD